MARVLIHVEGETEETFVKEVLARHLSGRGVFVGARLMGNSRLRQRRGGIRGWSSVRADIVGHLREDAGAVATTMVDYYGLPRRGANAWPGRDAAADLAFDHKAATVEQALRSDLAETMGSDYRADRFIPFVVMHEFEGLLFSDCTAFSSGIYRPHLQPRLQAIRDEFGTPEEINDSPNTAPSQRLIDIMPDYNKPIMGTLGVLQISLDTIRSACPHFNGWLAALEQLASRR